jgi:UDP-N-acetylmuramyl pentapeptide synthase
LKSPESYNNIYGLALTLSGIKRFTEIMVLECGTNNPGEINVLSELIQPEVMLITNIGEGHLENFKTIQGVLQEKANITAGAQDKSFLFTSRTMRLLGWCFRTVELVRVTIPTVRKHWPEKPLFRVRRAQKTQTRKRGCRLIVRLG